MPIILAAPQRRSSVTPACGTSIRASIPCFWLYCLRCTAFCAVDCPHIANYAHNGKNGSLFLPGGPSRPAGTREPQPTAAWPQPLLACLLACLCYCLSDRSGTCDRLHWSQPVGVAHAGTVRSVRSAPAVPQHRVRRGVAASPAVPEGLASSMHISACKLDERCPPCRPGGALGASYQTGPQVGGLHSLPPSPRPECWCRHPVMGEPDKVGHPGLEVPKAIARLPGSPFAITSVVDTST